MISRSDVEDLLDGPYFDKGVDYFHQGKVASVNILKGRNSIGSTVYGEEGKLYHQSIRFNITLKGYVEAVMGRCSCSVGFNCEHVVAALLETASRLDAKTRPKNSDRSPDPRNSSNQRNKSPVKNRTRKEVLYIFRVSGNGDVRVDPLTARFGEDGAMLSTEKYRCDSSGYDVSKKFLTTKDFFILLKLSEFSEGTWKRHYNWPEGKPLVELIQSLLSTGRVRSGSVNGPILSWGQPRRFGFKWMLDSRGNQSAKTLDEDGEELSLLLFSPILYIDTQSGLVGMAETDIPPSLAEMLAASPLVPPEKSGIVAKNLAILGGDNMPRPRIMEVTSRDDLIPRPVLTLSSVTTKVPKRMRMYGPLRKIKSPKIVYPYARIDIAYKGTERRMTPAVGDDIRVLSEQGVEIIIRDLDLEWEYVEELEEIAEDYEGIPPGSPDFKMGRVPKEVRESNIVFDPILKDIEQVHSSLIDFSVQAVPRLREEGWQIQIEKSWPFYLSEEHVSLSAEIKSQGENRFSLSLCLEAGDEELDLVPVILQAIKILPPQDSETPEDDLEKMISACSFYPQLKDGSRVRVEGAKLLPFVQASLEISSLAEFHRGDAGRISEFAEAIQGSDILWKGGKEILELGERLRALASTSGTEPPAAMKGSLRPYQKLGYGWLLALCDSGFGGVLADDMGLGKTVQALALLARRHLQTGTDRPSLLVAPTSLVSNWIREAARFVPDLKLLALRGPERKNRFGEIPDHHLIITTYPLVNRDHGELFSREYDLAILDEAQAVKNPSTSIAKRIRGINARQRVALTGTPMENNLEELWSLYDWLIPGFLGDRKSFNRNYRSPIEKHGDTAKQRLLSARLKPFLLRRSKEDVAKDLPAKTEIDEIIQLSESQSTLYEIIRVAMDERIRDAVREKGIARSRITILDALLRLRQVCCDPALVKLAAAKKFTDSSKRKRLHELLLELVAEGRKVLVFSQFVEMLRLIEKDVERLGWSYAMLHGQTRKRDEQIAKFQDGDAQLFLISLKAGGVGLNLTAADTVILYDPWWNPAVERQAMDRAHRIGQENPVFVYRMIAEGSVEATIVEMQARKRALADALFEGGGEGALALTEEDLNDLLMPIG